MSSYRLGVAAHALEEGGPADVARRRLPTERRPRRDVEAAPVLVAGEGVLVALAEHVRVDGASNGLGHFGRGRPDVAQEHGRPSAPMPSGSLHQVGVEGPGEGVGDDERRRGQVVHADVGVDASLEVPVSREHGAHGQVGLDDCIRHAVEKRTRVADAGGAAVADEVVAERLEWFRQPGFGQVVGDDPGARSERGLDPRLGPQPSRHRLLARATRRRP